MLKKIYRLKEREVKKVLGKTKPFFSYGIVLNTKENRKNYNRFAIVIGSKSVNTNVTRTFFRRRFYDFIKNSKLNPHPTSPLRGEEQEQKNNILNNKNYDFVFVVKKQTKLDKKDKKAILDFEKDLSFLEKKFKTP